MDQLKDVVRGPADEESQADGHCHPGHLPGAHPQTPRRQWCHAGGHVLEDLEEHQADDGQRYSKCQEELVKSKPVCVSDWVRQKESTGHQAIWQRHQACVHPHGDDGEQRQTPHQAYDQRCYTRGANVVEADGMDGSQVTVKSHCSEDVSTDNLAIGVECSDDRTHCGSKVPGTVAQQLVDEKWHPKKKQEINN